MERKSMEEESMPKDQSQGFSDLEPKNNGVVWYLVGVARTVLVVVVVILAIGNILVSALSFLVPEKSVSQSGADIAVKTFFQNEDFRILAPFIKLCQKSGEFNSTTDRPFLDALNEFARSLEALNIKLPETLDPRFFTKINSGVMMLRQANEIPAQVIRFAPK